MGGSAGDEELSGGCAGDGANGWGNGVRVRQGPRRRATDGSLEPSSLRPPETGQTHGPTEPNAGRSTARLPTEPSTEGMQKRANGPTSGAEFGKVHGGGGQLMGQ